MTRLPSAIGVVMSLVVVMSWPVCASAQDVIAWRDPSPHAVTFVAVDDDVRLEVLDWGGSGRAVVLLAGSGHSAHVFDEFAPKLADCCRVYAMTRRGYGASSQPASGYDDQRLADDVLRVLDALKIESPVLVGHSMAGGELTTLGNQHSSRLSGLVYLDALGDPADWPGSDPAYVALMRKLPPSVPAPPCTEDRTSFASFRLSQQCSMQVALPESELRNTFAANPDGSVGRYRTPRAIHDAIGTGQKKRDYSNVRVPVLALFEFPRTSLSQLRPTDPQPRNDEEREAVLAFASATKAFMDRWTENLTRSAPDARVVDLPEAGHYVFLTRETDALRELRAFVAQLRPEPAFASASVTVATSRHGDERGLRLRGGGEVEVTNTTLRELIAFAYQRHPFDAREVVGGPYWIDTERFDVAARAAGDHVIDADGVPRQTLAMLRALLAQRFGLSVSDEHRKRQVYALTWPTDDKVLGPRMRPSDIDCGAVMRGEQPPAGQGPPCGMKTPPGRLFANTVSMAAIASLIARFVDRPVVDATGLAGRFDIELEAAEIQPPPGYVPGPSDIALPIAAGPSILVAVREQLGLALEARTSSLPLLVVDRVERPDPK